MRTRTAFFILSLATLPAVSLAATPVTFCGQTVQGGGVLQADLDCTNESGFAVTLANGGALNLGGFTLTAHDGGVQCLGRCRIAGPGTIARAFPSVVGNGTCIGVSGVRGDRVRVSDVAFSQFGWAISAEVSATLKRVSVHDGCFGVAAGRSVRITDSTITDNTGYGARSFGKLRVVRSTITGQLRDLWSPVAPRVVQSTCVTSSDDTSPAGIDFWNVCP